jgi:hypothetical protein
VGTNVCTELARRTGSEAEGRAALLVSGRIDRLLNAPGGSLVGITGIGALVAFGYSPFTPWIAASIMLMAYVIALGIGYWRRFGTRVALSLDAGDWMATRRLLKEPRRVAISRIENAVVVSIVALMVLRPS